jgi:hypothetical protein
MKNSKSNRADYSLSFFVATYFFIEALNSSIKQLFYISDSLWTAMSDGFMYFLLFLLVLTIKHMLRRKGLHFIIAEIVYLGIYAISFFRGYASTGLLLSSAFQTIGIAVPIAFYVISVSDKRILLNVLRKFGYVQSVLLIVTLFSMNDKSTYSMSASYFLVLPSLLFLSSFFSTRSLIDFLFASISILSILLYGARGPLLGIAVYIAIKVIFAPKLSIKKIVFLLIVGSLLVYVLVAWDSLLLLLSRFLQARNIHSRTLNAVLQSSITRLSGRDTLFKYYWNLALQKPLTGWGAYGRWIGSGSGPHNTLIELIVVFGFVVGPIIILFSVFLLFHGFFIKDPNYQELSIIYSSRIVPMFLVSGGFFTAVHWMIFFIMGIHTTFFLKGEKEESKNYYQSDQRREAKRIKSSGLQSPLIKQYE